MKLITETIEHVNCLVEAVEGAPKQYFIEGVFLQSELENRNRRVYPKAVLEREVARYVKDFVNENRAVGELGHPDTPNINLDRVSHKIISLREDGNNFIGKAKILDTPFGRIVKNFMDEGIKIGVSSRGMGSLKPMKEAQMVQDDYFLATAADIVADPSAPDAFVHGIMENKEWIWENGIIKEADIAQIRKDILGASRKQLEEVTLRNFSNFLKRL
jgi:hypothetical protein